jgi:hypothetical protein
MIRLRHVATALLLPMVAGLAGLGALACSDEDRDDAQQRVEDLQEDVEDAAGTSTARLTAEALRGVLVAGDSSESEGPRTMTVLQGAIDDLPGDPTIVGVEDADGDGQDDDGRVEVQSGDQAACLTLPETGTDIDVSSDACPE